MSTGEGFSDELKAGIRKLIAEKGSPVQWERDYDGEIRTDYWGNRSVSPYGWRDWRAEEHCRPVGRNGGGCRWEVPEGSFLYEDTYSMFQDTFSDNEDEAGINVSGCRCACGKYEDVTLRWVGTLAQLINELVPKEEGPKGWTL